MNWEELEELLYEYVDPFEVPGAIEAFKKSQFYKFYDFLWNVINPNEMEIYISMFNTTGEKVADDET